MLLHRHGVSNRGAERRHAPPTREGAKRDILSGEDESQVGALRPQGGPRSDGREGSLGRARRPSVVHLEDSILRGRVRLREERPAFPHVFRDPGRPEDSYEGLGAYRAPLARSTGQGPTRGNARGEVPFGTWNPVASQPVMEGRPARSGHAHPEGLGSMSRVNGTSATRPDGPRRSIAITLRTPCWALFPAIRLRTGRRRPTTAVRHPTEGCLREAPRSSNLRPTRVWADLAGTPIEMCQASADSFL